MVLNIYVHLGAWLMGSAQPIGSCRRCITVTVSRYIGYNNNIVDFTHIISNSV